MRLNLGKPLSSDTDRHSADPWELTKKLFKNKLTCKLNIRRGERNPHAKQKTLSILMDNFALHIIIIYGKKNKDSELSMSKSIEQRHVLCVVIR